MKRIVFFISLYILAILPTVAQQFVSDNIYQINKFGISPAYAGYTGNWESFMTFRQNWVGVPGAPRKQILSTNSPFKNNMGLGVTFDNEQTGNFSHFSASVAYAYKLSMGKSNEGIIFGFAPEFYRNQLDVSRIKGDIETFEQNLVGTSFDASFGVFFHSNNLNVGFAAPRIVGLSLKYDSENSYGLARSFLVHGSYAYDVKKDELQVQPMFLLRATQNMQMLYELSVLARYKETIWLAVSYRSPSSIGISSGMTFSDRIVINYSYELGMNGIAGISSGSHEVSLGFLIRRSQEKEPPLSVFRKPFPEELTGGGVEDDTTWKVQIKKLEGEIVGMDTKIKTMEPRIKNLEKTVDSLKNLKPADSKEPTWGDPIILDVKFGNNSDRLFSSSYPVLNKLASELMRQPNKIIKITGHTDNQGSKVYNQRLSEKRAEAVKAYLVDNRKIDADRIVTLGKGPDDPRDTNDTPAGMARNRRIEAQFATKP